MMVKRFIFVILFILTCFAIAAVFFPALIIDLCIWIVFGKDWFVFSHLGRWIDILEGLP